MSGSRLCWVLLLAAPCVTCAPVAPARPAVRAAASAPDADEGSREVITRYLFEAHDFRNSVCGDAPPSCDEATFRDGLTIEHDVLAESPPIVGYFASPKRHEENFYTGVFLLRDGQLEPHFIFFGAGIAPSDCLPRRLGVKSLEATERVTPLEWSDTVYEWNGETYVVTRSTTRK